MSFDDTLREATGKMRELRRHNITPTMWVIGYRREVHLRLHARFEGSFTEQKFLNIPYVTSDDVPEDYMEVFGGPP